MRLSLLLLVAMVWAGPAAAASPESTVPLVMPTDEELAARVGFLEERLDAARPTALTWQYGWTGIYTAGLVSNTVYAVRADDGDERVRSIVDAAKSALATAEMVSMFRDPLPGTYGAQPMREVPGDGRAVLQQRVAVGERLLRQGAERAQTRYSWSRHLLGIATNLLGGAIIWSVGDGRDAAESTLIGIAVGEAQIWSEPWRATGDLRDYEQRFPGTGVSWELRGRDTGVELALHF